MGGYHLDLSRISIDEFFGTLREGSISPGRRILLERQQERRAAIRGEGVELLSDLTERLKTKPKLSAFAAATGLSVEYLTILRRQALSYLPKPVPLEKFPGVSDRLVRRLAEAGVKHGKHLFDATPALSDVATAAARYEVDEASLRELRILVDLSRITGVGPIFARFFYDIGVRGVVDLASRDVDAVLENLAAITADYTGPQATRWDVEHCIRTAAALAAPGPTEAGETP